jgi:murein tripeptide amidase MpaA
VAENPIARVIDIGSTVDGRDMNLVVIGNPPAEKKIWVIARQHPGESMAEWFVEGMMDALLDNANPVARKLLQSGEPEARGLSQRRNAREARVVQEGEHEPRRICGEECARQVHSAPLVR